jgi:lipoprotein-releasing system ATP-binding protein
LTAKATKALPLPGIGAKSFAMENKLVELKSVSKRYGDRVILDHVDADIAAGERLSIIGPSGSGKSTLLNIIGLLDDPGDGSYQFDGTSVGGMAEAEKAGLRGRSIGFIFQLHHLLPQLSVLENVTLPAHALATKPNWGEVDERGRELLEKVGLKGQEDKLPAQLSGGERQRVAVVRALINRPKLLLADEPTGALDRANADGLTKLLLDLNASENTALVVVTHDEAIAKAIGSVAQIKDGKLERV